MISEGCLATWEGIVVEIIEILHIGFTCLVCFPDDPIPRTYFTVPTIDLKCLSPLEQLAGVSE